MSQPILYGPAYSTYARSVRLALAEKGVDYRLEEVDIFAGAHTTEAHLKRHPFAKVPAFEHDGFALYETPAIMRYVDEAFDGPGLQPAGVHARARMTQAISIVDAYAYPSLITAVVIQRLIVPRDGGTPDEAVIEAALPRAEQSVRAFETMLEDGNYLAGDALSLADLHLVPVFDYFRQTPDAGPLLAKAPNLAEWWKGLETRDSVVATRPSLG